VGEKVLWYNADSVTHTVTSLSTPKGVKGPDLILNPGGSGEFVFHTQGTYIYYCTIHPWKGGVVNVIPESAGEGVIVGY
jgi:plastocyanin